MEQPGFLQAVVNALRGGVGMGAQQSPGPATNLQSSYRDYLEQVANQVGTPLSLRDWQNSQSRQ